jgi:predicted RNase H-like nuclease (RuvC/YqgF family)
MKRTEMDGRIFDQDYIVREAVDDVLSKVETREKLIESARDLAEKRKEDNQVSVIKNFETLMVDFLHFYQPLLEKIRRHEGTLQESITDLKSHLSSTKSMLQVTKTIEGDTTKAEELDREISGLERSIQSKTTTVDRIKKLFEKTKRYQAEGPAPEDDEERTVTHRHR